MDTILRMIEAAPDTFEFATTADGELYLKFIFLVDRLAQLLKTSQSVRKVWGSSLGPVKFNKVSPTALLRCFLEVLLPRC